MNKRQKTSDLSVLAGHVVLIILVIWVFLLAYNGGYDMLVMLLILPVAIFLWRHPGVAGLSIGQTRFVIGLFIIFQLLLSSPFTIANNLTLQLPYLTLDLWIARMYIFLLLTMLILLLCLLARLKTPSKTLSRLKHSSSDER
jgi:hypothetical protein